MDAGKKADAIKILPTIGLPDLVLMRLFDRPPRTSCVETDPRVVRGVARDRSKSLCGRIATGCTSAAPLRDHVVGVFPQDREGSLPPTAAHRVASPHGVSFRRPTSDSFNDSGVYQALIDRILSAIEGHDLHLMGQLDTPRMLSEIQAVEMS